MSYDFDALLIAKMALSKPAKNNNQKNLFALIADTSNFEKSFLDRMVKKPYTRSKAGIIPTTKITLPPKSAINKKTLCTLYGLTVGFPLYKYPILLLSDDNLRIIHLILIHK